MAPPIVPPGLQPVIAWCADQPYHLRVVGDMLTWLTGGGERPTYRWQLPLAAVDPHQAIGQLLVPGDQPEAPLPDGTLVQHEAYNRVDACCERDTTVYYHHAGAIHERSPDGGDRPFATLPPTDPPDAWRTIEATTWVDERLYVIAEDGLDQRGDLGLLGARERLQVAHGGRDVVRAVAGRDELDQPADLVLRALKAIAAVLDLGLQALRVVAQLLRDAATHVGVSERAHRREQGRDQAASMAITGGAP
ncbi:MAG: hypothetical protein IPJ61_21285 [Tessaracoccus sp.]|uniref:hypothetical protein n=1 Tax=Tessaracoccus sp. TaxID=1971211 RepID=UPI001ECFB2A1|nr:hypothetical protein [Tessaracoccus sp.]MBK7823523.1 hypothetical protein [Tessaracoccus sp.]